MTLGDGDAEGELRVGKVKDLEVRLEIFLEVSHGGMSLMSSAGHLRKREGFTATISSVEERNLSLLMMASGASNSSHDLLEECSRLSPIRNIRQSKIQEIQDVVSI